MSTENKLYPFQAEDCERMNQMHHVLLFSDMGTGKTIESIYHVEENNLKPCLILCPRSLKYNWFDEIEKWTNQEAIICNTADDVVNDYFWLAETKQNRRIYYILHHDALAYVQGDDIREILPKISWRSVIIDEVHKFRNLNTYKTSELMKFRLREEESITYPKFMFVSGTPIVNSNFDMYFMLKMIKVEESPGRFIEKYTIGYESQYGYKVTGSKNTVELLNKISPFYIRRTRDEVLKELPDKIQTITKLDMTKEQREVYDHYVEMLCLELDNGEKLSSPSILSLLTRLRQISLDPTILGRKLPSSKTRAVLDLLDQNTHDKWVVASTSKQYIKHLGTLINNSITYTGDDSLNERHLKLQRFQNNPNYRILLITMQTGGLGLNLQAASNIICTDYWWNSATLEQQIARLYRIGQKNCVLVYILHNKNSIDDYMASVCKKKEDIINEVVVKQDIVRMIYEQRRGYAPDNKANQERG